jgi:proteasome lid subunit RPN8/RPN11
VPEHPFRRLVVPADVLAAIIEQALAEAPLECVGLLGGQIRDGSGVVEVRYPLVNEAASPVEFVSAARGMLDATRDLDRRVRTLLAVYHSHPAAAPIPSRTDLERSYSAEVASVIVSLQSDPPAVRAWWLWDRGFEECELAVEGPAGE